MKKVLFLVNHYIVIYNFRKELVQKLIAKGFDVYVSCPAGERIDELKAMGCNYIEADIERHGKNPIDEIKLIRYYKSIIRAIKPDVVLSYTIKPNLYGGIAASSLGIPYIANITGLGMSLKNDGIFSFFIKQLYRIAFKKVNCVFFQNSENKMFFEENNISMGKHRLIPGSGVNLNEFQVLDYPDDDIIEFVFISRIMKDKGIDHYLEAAEAIKVKYPHTNFHICGFCEEAYEEILKQKQTEGLIIYHGMVSDIREILKDTHCTVLPTYHEGMSNVLQEASASGRPCLCSDIPGCKEIVDDGITGFLFEVKNTQNLIDAIEKFLTLSHEERKQMGINARKKVEKEFSRQIIIDAYMEEINKIMGEAK